MPISIRKAVAADIPAMGALDVAGYGNSPFRRAMFPPERRVKPGDGDALEWFERGARRALGSPTTHYIVAVEDEGSPAETIVGMAVWESPQTAAAAAAAQEKGTADDKTQGAEAETKAPPPGRPSYIGYEQVMEASKEIQTMLDSQDALDENARSDMWTLNAIVVNERHRRKGVGKALVQWGIDQATREDRQVWLIATSDGKKLYDSMGFSVVGSGSRCGEAQHLMFRSAT